MVRHSTEAASIARRGIWPFVPPLRWLGRRQKIRKTEAKSYYKEHHGANRLKAMTELYNLPVIDWPDVYLALDFREYWDASIKVLQTGEDDTLSEEDILKRIKECN